MCSHEYRCPWRSEKVRNSGAWVPLNIGTKQTQVFKISSYSSAEPALQSLYLAFWNMVSLTPEPASSRDLSVSTLSPKYQDYRCAIMCLTFYSKSPCFHGRYSTLWAISSTPLMVFNGFQGGIECRHPRMLRVIRVYEKKKKRLSVDVAGKSWGRGRIWSK